MGDGDQQQQLARIDAALARIEAAATHPRPDDAAHARLRAAVGGALARLDMLITAQEGAA